MGQRYWIAKGWLIAPGLIDMRVFVGEPGLEHRETLRTAGEAAAAGGINTIICQRIPIRLCMRWPPSIS